MLLLAMLNNGSGNRSWNSSLCCAVTSVVFKDFNIFFTTLVIFEDFNFFVDLAIEVGAIDVGGRLVTDGGGGMGQQAWVAHIVTPIPTICLR